MKAVLITIGFLRVIKPPKNDLHEDLGCMRELVGCTAAATSAFFCGTNDRGSNELQVALRLVDSVLSARRAATTTTLSRQRTHPRHDGGGDIGERGGGDEVWEVKRMRKWRRSVTKVQEEMMDQVKMKRMSRHYERCFFFSILVEFMRCGRVGG